MLSRIDEVRKAAIYKITCLDEGKVYIGQAVNFNRRVSYHKWRLRNGQHLSKDLQTAWDNYGELSFVFERIVSFLPGYNREFMTACEQGCIDMYDASELYNTTAATDSNFGKKFSEVTKVRMKTAQNSPEVRAKLSATMNKNARDAAFVADVAARSKHSGWKDVNVIAARMATNRVRVTECATSVTSEYNSVHKAFVALGLDVAKHKKFRAQLKEYGKLRFLPDDGRGSYLFEVIYE